MSIFFHYEAEAILKIPLNPTWPEHLLIWNLTTNGQYTVKYDYKIGMEFLQSHTTTQGTSNTEAEIKTQTMIHKLQCNLRSECSCGELLQIFCRLDRISCDKTFMTPHPVYIMGTQQKMTDMLYLIAVQKKFVNTCFMDLIGSTSQL